MKRSIFGCGFAMLAAFASPTFAGTVYVPVTQNVDNQGVRVLTHVWLSNQGDTGRAVGAFFLAADTDGTERDELTERQIGVPAKSTVFVDNAAANGARGMFEVLADDPHGVRAVLVSQIGGVTVDEDALPVISSANLLPAGSKARIIPLGRGDETTTDLFLVNLGHEAAACSVKLAATGGAVIGAAAVVPVEPLSVHRVADALATPGGGALAGVKAIVSCDQSFYALGVTLNRRTGALAVVEPAEQGTSTLLRPGDEPSGPPCPAGGQCFELGGAFFVPTRSNPERIISLPVGQNREFGKFLVEFEFTHGGWFSRLPDGIHRIFWVTRNGDLFDSHSYAKVTTRGPNRNLVRNEVTADMAAATKIEITERIELQPGTTYLVRYLFDTAAGAATLTLTDKATNQVALTLVVPGITNRVRTQAGAWSITVSDGEEGVHAVNVGWVYSNLKVQWLP